MKSAAVLALATGSASAFVAPVRNGFGLRSGPTMMASGSITQLENRDTSHPPLPSTEPGASVSGKSNVVDEPCGALRIPVSRIPTSSADRRSLVPGRGGHHDGRP